MGFRKHHLFQRSGTGFTMVETLVALGVLAIFFLSVVVILRSILHTVASSRIRTTALALAQQKMEAIRNLPYTSVGTAQGIPQGSLPQTETITISGQTFTVKTNIVYIDDPFDGIAPSDIISADYKRTRVDVSWSGAFPSKYPVTLVTNIVPKGIETTSGGGTLFIQVFDANSLPVSNASVAIDNTSIVPEIHIQTLTDANGFVSLPGAPACVACYKITATKTGYSTSRTYGSSEVTNPLTPHPTVIEGQITQLTLAIDRVSALIVNSFGSRESGYPILGNVLFTLRGSKTIGTDTLDEPVYKYSFSTNTGGGTVSIPDLEWDTYTLDLTNSYHDLGGSNPVSPFALPPNTTLTAQVVGIPKTNTSLLVVAKTSGDIPLASVSAQLTSNSLAFDQTKFTGATGSADFGQTFFSGLTSGNYDLKISLAGYEEATASVSVAGVTQESLILNPVSL
ncbi:hypothetical protein HY409_02970 [Candidatus Gottesmanbacteria bacterium]|nr:hypothetical protein [Candidatus Gottesmanbacteria bacterium]